MGGDCAFLIASYYLCVDWVMSPLAYKWKTKKLEGLASGGPGP